MTNDDEKETEYLSVADIAKEFGVAPQTAMVMLKDKKIEIVKIDGVDCVQREQFETWLGK